MVPSSSPEPNLNSQPVRKPFWRFAQFSLGSLLLFVLLIGASATAWWRWDAWILKKSLGGGKHGRAFFAADGKVIFFVRMHRGENSTCFDTITGMKMEIPETQIISADGRWCVEFQYDQSQLILAGIQTKETKTLIAPCEAVLPACFSPDSKLLAVSLPNNAVKVWDIDAFKEVFVTSDQAVKIDQFGFSPDNKLMYALGMDGVLRFFDPNTGKLLGELRSAYRYVQFAVFSRDFREVLTACSDAKARLYSVPELKLERTLESLDDYLYAAAFSDDGRLIATSTWSGTVQIWVRGKGLIATLKSSGARANTVSFSPDGQRLVTGGSDASADVWDTTGRQALHLPAEPETNSFSPPVPVDTTAPQSKTTEAEEDFTDGAESPAEAAWQKAASISGHSEQISDSRYVAKGSIIVTSSVDDTVRLWDAENGDPIHPESEGSLIAVTPDGKKVALRNEKSKTIEIWERRRKQSESRFLAQPEIGLGGVILILIFLNIFRRIRGARQ